MANAQTSHFIFYTQLLGIGALLSYIEGNQYKFRRGGTTGRVVKCALSLVFCMAKTEEVTYELQILIASRWETQGVYTAKQQQIAVADAKSLDKVSTVKGVKVVKEIYDKKTGSSRSTAVYESAPAAPKKAPPRAAKPPAKATVKAPPKGQAKGNGKKNSKPKSTSGGSMSDAMTSAPPPMAEVKSRPSILATFAQVLLALAFAVGAAMVVTQLASMGMRDMRSIGFLARNDFLVIVFILVFAITSLALVTRILTKLKGLKSPSLPSIPRPAAQSPARRPQARPTGVKPLPPSPESLEAEDLKTEEKEEPEKEPEPEEKPEEEPAPVPEPDMLSEMVTMNAFTAGAVEVMADDKDQQDAHKVFGLVLFLVGASQTLRHKKRFSEEVFQKITNQTLGTLGLAKERAEYFVEHIDEYLISNARYSEMFQQGRQGMSEFLEDGTGPRGMLAEALTNWEKPKGKSETSQPVTVLFTDIAGSTAMTQEMGDEGAQKVVRVHNVIVREAIQAFSGKEIKHTGDGIMASFPSAAAGVEAANEMQKSTKAHNKANPDLPLGLKIGLNTGEPISEDDDLFGTTVQLAARIVDKACAGHTLVSGSVQGLSQGKSLKFERFADLDMKGFDEAVTVYTAVWDPDTPSPVYTPPPKATPAPVVETAPAAQAPAAAPATKPDAAS